MKFDKYGQNSQKPELTLKRKWLILKIFLFIYFGFFSIKIYLRYLKFMYKISKYTYIFKKYIGILNDYPGCSLNTLNKI